VNGNANRERKIAMVGPILPLRGGIAQHTTMLHRALQQFANIRTFSFSRQYPAWLFPGESDRDPAYEGHREPGVEYLIDSVNPLTWRKVVQEISDFDAEEVIFPWWTIFWVPTFGYMARALRKQDRKIVFFCHNVVEHEAAWWKTALSRNVLKLGDRFVVHTREDQHNLKTLLPDAQVSVHPHPIYDQFPEPKGIFHRRRKLELLFYGFVRPYKGLDLLVEAMGRLKNEDVQLTVAGEFWEGEEKIRERIEELDIIDQVELRPRYHTDQETAELFDRADVVVLPYRSATGSGVVPIAYHYNKPVIVTRVGGLPDVVQKGKTGLLVTPNDENALAQAILTISNMEKDQMKKSIKKLKQHMSWPSLAKTLIGSNEISN
jgi:glycosyltransferase involved in cell wall biosynthesis